MRKPIISLLIIALIALSISASADEFYIVRDQITGECRVVQNRPIDITFVVVNDVAYTTEENALGVIRTVCTKH